MKLDKYQALARTYIDTEDPVEQVARAVMYLYGLSYDDVNNMGDEPGAPRFVKLTTRTASKLKCLTSTPWYYRLPWPLPGTILQTNAERITYGQFIEVQHFIKMGDVECLPFVAASILLKRTKHRQDVKRMLNTDARRIVLDVKTFLTNFKELVESYSGLFERQAPTIEATDEEITKFNEEQALELHPFIEQYGWHFTARQIATHHGITLNQAYDLPILEALNTMAYLKSEIDYNEHLERSTK